MEPNDKAISAKKLHGEIDRAIFGNTKTIAEFHSLIDEQMPVSDWIPCSERLPESVGNKVIVFCTGEDVSDYVGFGHYEKFKHIERWYNLETGFPFADWGLTVTHWMPRPEPPEKEDADDA